MKDDDVLILLQEKEIIELKSKIAILLEANGELVSRIQTMTDNGYFQY